MQAQNQPVESPVLCYLLLYEYIQNPVSPSGTSSPVCCSKSWRKGRKEPSCYCSTFHTSFHTKTWVKIIPLFNKCPRFLAFCLCSHSPSDLRGCCCSGTSSPRKKKVWAWSRPALPHRMSPTSPSAAHECWRYRGGGADAPFAALLQPVVLPLIPPLSPLRMGMISCVAYLQTPSKGSSAWSLSTILG